EVPEALSSWDIERRELEDEQNVTPSPEKSRKNAYLGIGMALALLGAGVFLWTDEERAKKAYETAKEIVGLRGTGDSPSAIQPAPEAQQGAQPEGPVLSQGEGSERRMVRLSPEEEKAIGVETEVVTYRPLQKEIYTVGRIDYDERKLAFVPARIAGRLDKLYVNFAGAEVKKGEPLALIYSPDLVAAQREYQLAFENLEKVKGSDIKEVVESARSLVEASQNKLRLWGLTAEQIAEIKARSNPSIHVTIYSPTAGTVIEKMVLEGKYVAEGENLYKIADLSTVWMFAEVYEYELPWVRLGQRVEITSLSTPGNATYGTVSFIDPIVNPNTRTVKIRADIPNPEKKLKPQMFVNAKLIASLGEKVLAVPKSAVLDTGLRQLVYVEKGDGLYEAGEVTLGPEAGGYYPVVKGLKPGEKVVVHGNFLIDSQAQLTGPALSVGSPEAAGPARAEETPAKLKIAFSTSPKSPIVGKNTLKAKVTDQAGKPVTDAKVVFSVFMPPMPGMGEMRLPEGEGRHTGDGEYEAQAEIPMAGSWKVVVRVLRPGQSPTSATFSLTVR
ncbi:MAG: efflux RND transporter periplasmic adaptor subunit, partial [Candidatus Methylomirabilales bacterium]